MHEGRRPRQAGPPAQALYTADERRRRDASPWTLVQGILAPVQFLVFLVSLAPRAALSRHGRGLRRRDRCRSWSRRSSLYAIMITGSIWEKEVFGRYLFAPAFFWEDVFSILVLALHTAYLAALFAGLARPRAADAARAGRLRDLRRQCRAVPAEAARRASRRAATPQRPLAGSRAMNAHIAGPDVTACERLRDRSGPARARPARGVLRADGHRLAAPQDPGRVLPRGRLAHLRAPDPVRGRRDDLRRAALRHRDHRRARSRRPRRRATRSSTAS